MSMINKERIQQFRDDRGMLVFASPTLLDFNYKYLTMGTIEPGCRRGAHYHTRIVERLLCLSGEIEFRLEKNGVSESLILYPGEIADIPIHHIHTLLNVGNDVASFVEFKSEEFDQNDKDTYSNI
jgi:mannose-6-phosphate isomerase-like protein (cupin superfamily)